MAGVCFEMKPMNLTYFFSPLPSLTSQQKKYQVVTVNGARVVKPDIQATNGIIHVVDRVLFPVPEADIYNTLRKDPQQRYTTLISAIDRAGLQLVLGDPRSN